MLSRPCELKAASRPSLSIIVLCPFMAAPESVGVDSLAPPRGHHLSCIDSKSVKRARSKRIPLPLVSLVARLKSVGTVVSIDQICIVLAQAGRGCGIRYTNDGCSETVDTARNS